MNFAKKCVKCQMFTSISLWLDRSFAKWGIDLAGPMLKERSNMRFIIIVMGYFTKWLEVESFVNIIETNTCKFI